MTETEKLCTLLKENHIDFEQVNSGTTMWKHEDDECDADGEYVAWEDEGRLFVEQPIKVMTAQRAIEVTTGPNGSTSDGYHTFDELYDHRTGLLMALCNTWCAILRIEVSSDELIAKEGMYKSRHHDDGSMFDNMFIVGINCSKSAEEVKWATWHCEDRWWDMFDIPELERAPEWDGHTPSDALGRLVDAFKDVGGGE